MTSPARTPLTPSRRVRRPVLSHRVLVATTSLALAASILIVVTGGVVRVSASGLGCPTWPVCAADSLTPTAGLGVHGIIEFSNRVLTAVLCGAVATVILAATLQRPATLAIVRLAWSQLALIIVNAVVGGISVWTGLNPYIVAVHFIMAMGLLTTTTMTWHRAVASSHSAAPPSSVQKTLSETVVGFTAVLIVAGTVVSGAGPHSGAADATSRIAVPWLGATIFHGALGSMTLLLAGALLISLGRQPTASPAIRRVIVFLGVLVAQAAVGIIQTAVGLPDVLVVAHLLGAAAVWVGVLRVYLDVNPTVLPTLRPRSNPNPSPRRNTPDDHDCP